MKPEEGLRRENNTPELRAALMKERLLLIGASAVLIAHLVFNVTIEKSAETLGLKFEIDDPNKLWWVVWSVWAWALFRYTLYFFDFERSDMKTELATFKFRAHARVVSLSMRWKAGTVGVENRPPAWLGVKVVDVQLGPSFPEKRPGGEWEYPTASIRMVWHDSDSGHFKAPQIISRGWLFWSTICAWARLLLTTRHGTEYFAPFLIGLAPLVVLVLKR